MYLSLPTFVSKKGRKIAIADPGPPPPLVLDQTEARGTEKISLGDRLPLAPLSKGLDEPPIPPPPTSYLKVWIRVFVWTDQGWFIYQLAARI